MICSRCGGETEVLATLHNAAKGYTARRLACIVCDNVFLSYETAEEPEFVKARLTTYEREEKIPESVRNKRIADQDTRALYELKRANLLHLIDLKRAGHSPTQTELRISRTDDRKADTPWQRLSREVG